MPPEPRSLLAPDGQSVLDRAGAEARRFNHRYIGTEHLLLALVGGAETTASRVLNELGVDLDKVRNAVEFIVGRGDRAPVGDMGFTPRTRTVLALALAEAKQHGKELAGPEHLLLGLIREGEGIAVGVLESLGVSLAIARRQTLLALGLPADTGPTEGTIERRHVSGAGAAQVRADVQAFWTSRSGRGEQSAMQNDRFDKFSQRARQVLALAQEEAQRFNHNYIGTEHLLLGLVREGEGVAAKVLRDCGVDIGKARNAFEWIIGRGDRPPRGEIGLTARARKTVEYAVDEARRMGHHYIGAEHMLLGLIRHQDGAAIAILRNLSVDVEAVRAQTIEILSQSGGTSTAAGWQQHGSVERAASFGQAADLGALRRVLPLAQTQEHGEVAITAISLEDYEHGFRLILRVRSKEPGRPLPPNIRLPYVRPEFAASDDRGGRYAVTRGNSRSDPLEQRAELEGTSALDPAARQLRLHLGHADQRGPAAAAPDDAWTFTIALPG